MSRSNSAPRAKGENQDLTELLTASEDKPKDDGDEQSGFKSHASLLLRIALFAAACIFAILGVITLVNTNKTQVAAQQVAQQSVQAEPVAHVLVLVSYDQGDPDTAFEVKGVSDMLGRSSISSDMRKRMSAPAMANDWMSTLNSFSMASPAKKNARSRPQEILAAFQALTGRPCFLRLMMTGVEPKMSITANRTM